METADIHTLTGAYAVHALPEDERERFERHLADCDACATEVRELQETAARLGDAERREPPARLKQAVMGEIARTRQLPPLPGAAPAPDARARPTVLPPTRHWYQRLLAPAAAVLVLVVLGLTAVIANLNERIDDLEHVALPVVDVLSSPDAITVATTGPGGSQVRLVAAPSREEGVLLVDHLAPAPRDRVYQLWLMREGVPSPAGLLEVGDDGRGVLTMAGDMTRVDAVAMTVEPAGGSPQPTSDPVAVLELPVSSA